MWLTFFQPKGGECQNSLFLLNCSCTFGLMFWHSCLLKEVYMPSLPCTNDLDTVTQLMLIIDLQVNTGWTSTLPYCKQRENMRYVVIQSVDTAFLMKIICTLSTNGMTCVKSIVLSVSWSWWPGYPDSVTSRQQMALKDKYLHEKFSFTNSMFIQNKDIDICVWKLSSIFIGGWVILNNFSSVKDFYSFDQDAVEVIQKHGKSCNKFMLAMRLCNVVNVNTLIALVGSMHAKWNIQFAWKLNMYQNLWK